ncbi:MAG: ArsR/SmtB family transcription factor [Thermoplasmata archaeon]
MKYPAGYIVVVVSKEVETFCCGRNGRPLNLPEDVSLQIVKIGGMRGILRRLPDESAMKRAAKIHQALSDPVRVRILLAVSITDLCPCVLKQVVELSDSKLSYHLSVLEQAGLVASKRRKNWMIYSITPNGLRELNKK